MKQRPNKIRFYGNAVEKKIQFVFVKSTRVSLLFCFDDAAENVYTHTHTHII